MEETPAEAKEKPEPLSRGRRLSVFLLDFLLSLVGATLLTMGATSICSATSIASSLLSPIETEESQMIAMVEESHLNSSAGSGFHSINDLAKDYVEGIVKASLLHYGSRAEDLSSYYADVDAVEKESDRLYYYAEVYKPAHIADFSSTGIQGYAEIRSTLLTKLPDTYEESGDYLYLKADVADLVDQGLRDATYASGVSKANAISSAYGELLQKADDEFETTNLPYAAHKAAYKEAYLAYSRFLALLALACAAMSQLVFFLIVPICLRGGSSLSQKAHRAIYLSPSGEPIPAQSKIVRGLWSLLYSPLLAMGALLIGYGTNGLEITFSIAMGPFSLLHFAILSLIIALVSYLFSYFGKKQTLMELACRMQLEDGRE